MNIDITIPHQITIPDDELLDLARRARERFEQPADAPVHITDIINEAIASGLIDELEVSGWQVGTHEDAEYTDDELRAIIAEAETPPKKKRKGWPKGKNRKPK